MVDLGTGGNALYNSMWNQAAAEGITVIVSTGDNGSAGCDDIQRSMVSDSSQHGKTQGVQSGVASTPFNLAVGGTEFNDFANPFQFWQQATSSSASTDFGWPAVHSRDYLERFMHELHRLYGIGLRKRECCVQ